MWKEKEKKEDEETHTPNPVKKEEEEEEKKKRWSNVAAEYNSGSLHVVLFMEMSLKTKLWKLKIAKMCFQFS